AEVGGVGEALETAVGEVDARAVRVACAGPSEIDPAEVGGPGQAQTPASKLPSSKPFVDSCSVLPTQRRWARITITLRLFLAELRRP
ncbi:MAG: hypothetical protein AAF483_25985, partial [Planctomycetota bacterium]